MQLKNELAVMERQEAEKPPHPCSTAYWDVTCEDGKVDGSCSDECKDFITGLYCKWATEECSAGAAQPPPAEPAPEARQERGKEGDPCYDAFWDTSCAAGRVDVSCNDECKDYDEGFYCDWAKDWCGAGATPPAPAEPAPEPAPEARQTCNEQSCCCGDNQHWDDNNKRCTGCKGCLGWRYNDMCDVKWEINLRAAVEDNAPASRIAKYRLLSRLLRMRR